MNAQASAYKKMLTTAFDNDTGSKQTNVETFDPNDIDLMADIWEDGYHAVQAHDSTDPAHPDYCHNQTEDQISEMMAVY